MFDVKGIGEKRDLPEATCFLSTVTPNIVEEEGMASGPLEGHEEEGQESRSQEHPEQEEQYLF